MRHPSIEDLRRFHSGQLAATDIEQLAIHVEACPHCLDCLDELRDTDPLVAELRRCGPPPEELATLLQEGRIQAYRVLEELGRGGMGTVHRAFDERLKREVALKLMPTGTQADPEQSRRLRQEAETLAALRHPGIVQVYEVGEAPGLMYIALELLQPVGLAALGQRHGPRWCAAVIHQVASALDHAHQAGFIHRDIKPDNLLLTPVANTLPWWTPEWADDAVIPHLKITDFGLSKSLHQGPQFTRDGLLLGTPDYMAPEQVPDSGEAVGAAADIHALGAILYELLSGRPPFRGESVAQQLLRLRHDPPAPLRPTHPGVPRDLETICLKCLRKRPGERYPSARELAADLERFLQGEPIHARPPRLWEKLADGARQTPILASHLSGLALFYGLHLLAMWVLQEPAHTGENHTRMNLLCLSWLVTLLVLEAIHRQPRWRATAEYLYALLPMVGLQFENFMGLGPPHAPPMMFIPLLLGAVLMRPRLAMLWFATVAAQIAFTIYALVANSLGRPGYTVEHMLFFNLLILLIGVMLHLLLRQRGFVRL